MLDRDPAALRADAERHYDGRRQRLEAYAQALEVELASQTRRPGGSGHAVRLVTELAVVRELARLAARRRIPRGRAAADTSARPRADVRSAVRELRL